ncbi:hypothetical protein RHOER0001_4864 [Rhodococcus erythropolis SK121]|nr:hypothetical protein RHOER0001_4864 [Rhodococcus erythropolis SK121]
MNFDHEHGAGSTIREEASVSYLIATLLQSDAHRVRADSPRVDARLGT